VLQVSADPTLLDDSTQAFGQILDRYLHWLEEAILSDTTGMDSTLVNTSDNETDLNSMAGDMQNSDEASELETRTSGLVPRLACHRQPLSLQTKLYIQFFRRTSLAYPSRTYSQQFRTLICSSPIIH
jgi:hypothetical protein